MKSPWIDQKSFRASASSFVSSVWNSSLSPWGSPLRFSLFTVDSPVSEWVLWIRSLFLIMLLNHLPHEIRSLHLFWVIRTSFTFSLLEYASDASNFFQFFNLKPSPQIPPANNACPRRIPQICVHSEFSRLPGGLGHLTGSNSIS